MKIRGHTIHWKVDILGGVRLLLTDMIIIGSLVPYKQLIIRMFRRYSRRRGWLNLQRG